MKHLSLITLTGMLFLSSHHIMGMEKNIATNKKKQIISYITQKTINHYGDVKTVKFDPSSELIAFSGTSPKNNNLPLTEIYSITKQKPLTKRLSDDKQSWPLTLFNQHIPTALALLWESNKTVYHECWDTNTARTIAFQTTDYQFPQLREFFAQGTHLITLSPDKKKAYDFNLVTKQTKILDFWDKWGATPIKVTISPDKEYITFIFQKPNNNTMRKKPVIKKLPTSSNQNYNKTRVASWGYRPKNPANGMIICGPPLLHITCDHNSKFHLLFYEGSNFIEHEPIYGTGRVINIECTTPPTDLAYSQDSRTIIYSLDNNKTIHFFNIANQITNTLNLGSSPQDSFTNHDGTIIAYILDGDSYEIAKIYTITTNKTATIKVDGWVSHLKFTDDGKYLAIARGEGGDVLVYNAQNYELYDTLEWENELYHSAFFFSPCQKYLTVVSNSNKTLKVYDIAQKEIVKTSQFEPLNQPFLYHPKEKVIVFPHNDEVLELYNYEKDTRKIMRFKEYKIVDYKISPKGDKLLVSGKKQSTLLNWSEL